VVIHLQQYPTFSRRPGGDQKHARMFDVLKICASFVPLPFAALARSPEGTIDQQQYHFAQRHVATCWIILIL
jgi:hypothetical protein